MWRKESAAALRLHESFGGSHCDFGAIDYETLRRSSLNSLLLLLCVDLASPSALFAALSRTMPILVRILVESSRKKAECTRAFGVLGPRLQTSSAPVRHGAGRDGSQRREKGWGRVGVGVGVGEQQWVLCCCTKGSMAH